MRRKCRGGGFHRNRCENVGGGATKMVGRQKNLKSRGGGHEAKM